MTSYLVAGASRGIGLEITRKLSILPTTAYVFACARNPTSIPQELTDHAKIHPVKLDITSSTSTAAAIDTISKTTNGTLGVLIVNAGINIANTVSDASVEQLKETLETNTIAVHRIIQSCLPLLRAGAVRKIVVLGAVSGTFPVAHHLASVGLPASGAYAVSKVAVHMLIMLYAAELAKEGFVTASVHPGTVMTDMAEEVMQKYPKMKQHAEKSNMKLLTPAESADGIVKVIEELTVDNSGKLISWEGEVLAF
ncbi:hypothetical protein F5884DRAFT_868370 [Xylogone sp. PMI_703]|nr:hypothetical protein F5884DRAFT_868370 [Xylogone sp. PMI_703]